MAIPAHASLRLGTLNAILRAVAEVHGIGKAEVMSALAKRF